MRNSDSRVWLGVIFIAIGALFLIDNFGFFYFDIRNMIFSWHTIFLIVGVIMLSKHKNSTLGIIFLLIGLFGLLKHVFFPIFDLEFGDWWPIIIILIGLFIILRKNGSVSTRTSAQSDNPSFTDQQAYASDIIDDTAIFTSNKRSITSENFRGGKITTLLGSTKLDFSQSKLAAGEHTLDITCIFGGCTIIVPKNWKVIVNVTAVFGGFDDKRFANVGSTEISNGVLIIKGVVLFGGGEIFSI